MVWLMCTLEVFAFRDTRINALMRAAKIHSVVYLSVLVGAIQAEQPRPADGAIA